MRSNHEEQIDRILDSALSSYSAVDARPGIEQRVLNRVKNQGNRVGKRWMWPVPAALVAACLLSVSIDLSRTRNPGPRPADTVNQEGAATDRGIKDPLVVPPLNSGLTTRNGLLILRARSSLRLRRNLPKLATFPAPAPLTKEEREMFVLARYPAGELPKAILKTSVADESPVEIEPLRIEPL